MLYERHFNSFNEFELTGCFLLQTEEILLHWKELKNGGYATANDLITTLEKNQRAESCQPLIQALQSALGKSNVIFLR